jgi:hypothetical protein
MPKRLREGFDGKITRSNKLLLLELLLNPLPQAWILAHLCQNLFKPLTRQLGRLEHLIKALTGALAQLIQFAVGPLEFLPFLRTHLL